MSHIIYLIKNKITNKCYVGYTKYTIEKRWLQHRKRSLDESIKTPFCNALRKYNIDDWELTVLESCENAESAKEKEKFYINKFNSYENGYNATMGGDGNNNIKMSEESNLKRSIALKGKPKNYNRMQGKKHSEETLQKMRRPKQNKQSYQTEYFKQKMRETQAAYAKQKRSLTQEQYNKIHELVNQGVSKKKISELLSINYDIVKKWSCRKW